MQAQHRAVAGPTGGGKTTFLRQAQVSVPDDMASIYLTTKRNERKVTKNPPKHNRKSSCTYPADITTARDWALKQRKYDRVQIIVDEAHNAPSFQSGEGPLSTGIREDRSRGVNYVVATQNPQHFNNKRDGYGLVQQCEYWVFVGPAKDWHVGFFNANNMSGMIDHMPTENFEYVVINPIASLPDREKIIHRGTTSEKFA